MILTTVGLLCHPNGGICSFPAVEIDTEHIGLILMALEEVEQTPVSTALHEFIQSLTQPRISTNVTEDLPVYFLGYNRQHKAKFFVRLREAWNTLVGNPSQAYFTDENGEYADGTFKNAMRVTLDGNKVRGLAPVVYNSCLQDNGKCMLPLFAVPQFASLMNHEKYRSISAILSLFAQSK